MKVHILAPRGDVYRCVDYLILGTWNKLDNVNTLIDAGGDPGLIHEIKAINTGFGKRAVEQIILTHTHFDHTSAIKLLDPLYHPRIYAFSPLNERMQPLRDGQQILVGDTMMQVMHVPVHSHDSICLYAPDDRVLFCGDTIMDIKTPGGSYPEIYRDFIKRLLSMKIDIIYPGHGTPIASNIPAILTRTLENIQ